MKTLTAIALVLALVASASAQRPAHPYLTPDLASWDGTSHAAESPLATQTRGVSTQRLDGWLVAKILSTAGVGLASYADYQESQDAINERRAREANGFVRAENGYVNGKRKAALTAGYLVVTTVLYARGRKKLAVIADIAGALFFGGLAVRAHQIGR